MKYSKKIAILLFVVGCFSSAKAQNFKATDPIAINQKVKKGVLPNGMTYYIYPTEVNKNTASYYIIQNVGSILENDQQKGLAHFLEHMAFNGTKHFEGKGILNTLQKQGAVFGKNINAYTSTDETVYNLDNIPSKDGGVVDTCLLVLHDWSNFLSLTNEEIDAERGVITEEWRTRQNSGARIYNQLAPYYYNNSLYAERMPIGDMEIVKNFKYQVLKDFYKDWYRPDLQAIAIVGDINADEIEAKIKKLFADIPTPVNPKKRFEIAIPERTEPTFKLALDKEISSSNISFMIRHNAEKVTNTFAELEKSTQRSIAFSILNNRLAELTQKQECPFKGAQIGYQSYSRLNDIWILNVSPKPEKQAEAFALVMNEWVRAYKFGFSKGEIERAVTETTSRYENYLDKVNEISHQQVIGMVKSDYLNHEIIADPAAEFEMAKSILKNIDTAILQEQISKLYSQQNRVVAVTGVESEENLTQEKAFDIIQKAENDASLQPYVDTFVTKSLMDGVNLKPGKIVSEKEIKEIGATTYILSNGAKVHYKFADKNKKTVNLQAESDGGTSLYNKQDIPSAQRCTEFAMKSGLGSFTQTDLNKILKGKLVSCNTGISSKTEFLVASGNVKDIETMMQLVYLNFKHPRFDKEQFLLMKQGYLNSLKNREKDINFKMMDSLSVAVYGKDNPQIHSLSPKYIEELSPDKMKAIYEDRFSDISNFEFEIVGDVTPEILKPLLEKYIASIEGVKRKESSKYKEPKRVSNKIKKEIFIEMETPKSTVKVSYYSKEIAYSQRNKILIYFLNDILKLRYTESLREKEGGTYGAFVSALAAKEPIPAFRLEISFDCDANRVDQLLPVLYQEMDKIKKGEIVSEDIEKTRTNYFKSKADRKNFNRYSIELLNRYIKENYNMDDPKNYEDIVKSVTAKDIQDFANLFLSKAETYEIVFKPKK
ncbi:zinc protease [Flavobacterium nitrogenifigens]|uniref:Zinc protease n=2 Tax=Flavobacterium TaxID=237 RepID=A0A7W7N7N3_9FLAO|nr:MULTISPECIES: M16 family metallopeptidase [Flavobacterium]MBB4801571.1 zinc protease [Flavobacterium nitrogenifigens]MBB6386528.1 zinc protease [Flavobacterium notoginsengisoli]